MRKMILRTPAESGVVSSITDFTFAGRVVVSPHRSSSQYQGRITLRRRRIRSAGPLGIAKIAAIPPESRGDPGVSTAESRRWKPPYWRFYPETVDWRDTKHRHSRARFARALPIGTLVGHPLGGPNPIVMAHRDRHGPPRSSWPSVIAKAQPDRHFGPIRANGRPSFPPLSARKPCESNSHPRIG